VLAPRLLLLYPRRRQLSLQLSTPLGNLPGLAIASSLPGYGGAGGVDGWAAALIGRRRLAGWLSLNRRGAEETHGLLLAYEPAGRELGGGLLVQRRRVQRGLDPLVEGPRGPADFACDRCRIPRELGDELTLLGGCTLESGAIPTGEQRLLGLAQPFTGRKEAFDILGTPQCELVQRPGGDGWLAKRLDGVRLIT
jgi:hypothetical protein